MRYFKIEHSTNLKVIGEFPQVNKGIFKSKWDSPNSILIVHNEKVDNSNVEIPDLILNQGANLTDVLSVVFVDFKLIVSKEFKMLIESKNYSGVEYFKTTVYTKETKTYEYWFLNPFAFRNYYINFQSSFIKEINKSATTYIKVANQAELDTLCLQGRREHKTYSISKLSLFTQNINEDFFLLSGVSGGVGYYVSENLKCEIENLEITGIEFLEI